MLRNGPFDLTNPGDESAIAQSGLGDAIDGVGHGIGRRLYVASHIRRLPIGFGFIGRRLRRRLLLAGRFLRFGGTGTFGFGLRLVADRIAIEGDRSPLSFWFGWADYVRILSEFLFYGL